MQNLRILGNICMCDLDEETEVVEETEAHRVLKKRREEGMATISNAAENQAWVRWDQGKTLQSYCCSFQFGKSSPVAIPLTQSERKEMRWQKMKEWPNHNKVRIYPLKEN